MYNIMRKLILLTSGNHHADAVLSACMYYCILCTCVLCISIVRPISLLTLSLLTLLESNFPGNPLWAWEFHSFKLRLRWSQTLRNPQC